MSQDNVARLRESVEHLVATGEPEWAALHEDIEVLDHDIPDAGEYRGLSGFGRWLEDWASAWSEFSLEPEEYLVAGDSVVVVFLMKATGAGSGITVERRDAMVCKMRDLKIVRVDYYNNREQALKAVGQEKTRPEENVEVVRAAFQAFNRRDGAAFDALLASEAEIIPVRAAIEDVVYRGADAGSQYCLAVDRRWENLSWELEEIRDGDGWVLGLGHIRGRGRDSGAMIDASGAWVAEVRAGRITRFQTFSDRDAGLKAVGLEG